jgi:folate-dependent phosphoribosylglycinamide formyltransferase PurN
MNQHTRESRKIKHTVVAISNDIHARMKSSKPERVPLAAFTDILLDHALAQYEKGKVKL